MNSAFSIRPSKDIRTNYAKISELSRKAPVAITVNGQEDTVLISHEAFVEQQMYINELEAKVAVYTHLAQSADDVQLGRVEKASEVFDSLREELKDL